MGGFGSGSESRSWRFTTSEVRSLDIRGLTQWDLFPELDRPLSPQFNAPVELEIVALEDGDYDAKVWVGTRTGYGLGIRENEVARSFWLAETSMFIQITDTRPHLGGRRFWFVCPRRDCRRRCRVLYREPHTNARAFACRRCYRLAYPTQRMGRMDRIGARAEKEALKLIQTTEGELLPAKRMRRRTFDKIARKVLALDRAAALASAHSFRGLGRILGGLRR